MSSIKRSFFSQSASALLIQYITDIICRMEMTKQIENCFGLHKKKLFPFGSHQCELCRIFVTAMHDFESTSFILK